MSRDLLLSSVLSSSTTDRVRHSLPTRRSSDLTNAASGADLSSARATWRGLLRLSCPTAAAADGSTLDYRLHYGAADRKSTRLNSSHVEISYAVFCLKKKTHVP